MLLPPHPYRDIRESLLPYQFSLSETASIHERLAGGQLRRPPEVS
jgi:hypothetical protein